jgi:hypothetical protein
MFTSRFKAGTRALCAALSAALLAACAHAGQGFVPQTADPGAGGPSTSGSPARRRVSSLNRGDVRAIDAGLRTASQLTRVVFMLHYNHEAALRRLVAGLPRTHAHLTPREFDTRFDPTPLQESRAIVALHRAGFTIEKRYRNRLILDAQAPSSTVERFLSTKIHNFRQGRFGVRFSNVKPIRIPAGVAPLISTAIVDDVVRMHPLLHLAPAGMIDRMAVHGPSTRSSANAVRNPGFDTGNLFPWRTCSGPHVGGIVSIGRHDPQAGKYDAYVGSTKSREPNGRLAICQLVTVPPEATLTAWSRGVSDDASAAVAQFGALFSSNGRLVDTFWSYAGKHTDKRWVLHTADLSAYSGQHDYVAFGVIGSKHDRKTLGQFVDSIALLGASSTPTPAPTATPSATPGPTASPSPEPSRSPSPRPSITPVPPPTPTPTSTPVSLGYGPDAGWGPGFVASGFNMPGIAGYTGSGETVAIVIDAPASPTDLATYLSYYGITQTGAVTTETVDGGGSAYYNPDQIESNLDLETIAALAPSANVIVYDIASLDDQSVIDGYDQIVADSKATVVNSSFGGCESNDSSFDVAADAIAAGAAAVGTTFSASSGDTGSSCYPYGFGASAPASLPNFVAVGGTESISPAFASLYSYGCGGPATSITNPVVWNDCVGQGGAGVSSVFPTPGYQSDIAGANQGGRNVPDISLPSAYDDMYDGNAGIGTTGWFLVWGTSWSSPAYVAMQAEINQICGLPIWGIGALYTAYEQGRYRDFLDVTSGSDGFYSASAGFDVASGIGMPLGLQVAQDNGCAPGANRRKHSPRRVR